MVVMVNPVATAVIEAAATMPFEVPSLILLPLLLLPLVVEATVTGELEPKT